MSTKFLIATTFLTLAMVASLHINSQGQDTRSANSWTYGASAGSPTTGTVRFYIDAPNSREFLNDPVSAIRQNGMELTSAQETAWRQLTVALRRLANPQPPPAAGTVYPKSEVVYFQITMTDASVMPGRGWSAVAKAGGLQRFDRNAFFSDPVATLKSYGVDVPKADESTWRQLAGAVKTLRRSPRSSSAPRQSPDPSEVTTEQPTETAQRRRIIEGYSAEFYAGNSIENAKPGGHTKRAKGSTQPEDAKEPQAGTKEVASESEKETGLDQTNNKKADEAQPDLQISKFLFPPTADKKLRVHVVNSGPATSNACRLVLTVRKINGIAAGRKTHVNVPSLAAGENVWLLLDAATILPVNVSLTSTTFKLNVDATGLIAESDESNNEVWHNL